MPVLAPVGGRLTAFNGAGTGGSNAQALANTFFFQTHGRGVPRRDNLLGVRILESTHAVQIPLQAIKAQVAATPWMIRPPEGVESTPELEKAAKEVEAFLDGGFNVNRDSFVGLVKAWLGDILAIDAGILELVPDAAGALAELYVRDGATFTKAPDKHGRLPAPGSQQPAYWQFSLAGTYGFVERNDALVDVMREQWLNTGLTAANFKPIPFTRDQLVWTEENPRSHDSYGLGRLQMVRRVVELILNMDVSNKKWFTANEIPEGVLQFMDANHGEIERFRVWWDTNVKGKEHKLAIVGGKKAQWMPFRPTPTELQFLDSQRWYHKLVWFVFGVSGPEVGETEDVNLANGQEQAVSVWRRTTRPLLELLQQELNRKVLPYLNGYCAEGFLEFAWDYDNPAIQALRRSRDNEDLEKGTLTINEVRLARGQKPLPWGDMGAEDKREIVRRYPKWAMENWFGIAPATLPEDAEDFGGAGLFGLGAPPPDASSDFGTLTKAAAKEALRNEAPWKFPALTGIVRDMSGEVARVFRGLEDDIVRGVEASFPTKAAASFDVSRIVASIDVGAQLGKVAVAMGHQAMRVSADYHARRLETELAGRLPEGSPELVFRVGVEDTFAARNMAQRAAQRMRTVNETVQRLVRDTLVGIVGTGGGNVTQATRAIRDLFGDYITPEHARLVARTEVLMASRSGAQALAEGSALIEGKKWIATHDTRTRPWHAAMDGVVVPKDSTFTVGVVDARQRNRGYPKHPFVVGDDEPFNCRCDQAPVLRDDMPDLRSLARGYGLVRKDAPVFEDGLTDTQADILFVEGQPGESFKAMLKRMDEAIGNRKALAERLGVSRSVVYEWLGSRDADTAT